MDTAAQNHSLNGMEEGGWIFLSMSEDNLQIEGVISQSVIDVHHELDMTTSQ